MRSAYRLGKGLGSFRFCSRKRIFCSRVPSASLASMSATSEKPSEVTQTVQKTFEDRFFDSAAAGNTDDIKTFLKGAVNVDVKNERGWTALMFAARNGQTEAAQVLLQNGCDVKLMNSTGQTALDIALFWNNSEVARLLQSNSKDENPDENLRNYFSLNLLNRCAEKRKDQTWLKLAMQRDTTGFVLFRELKPFVVPLKNQKSKWKYSLARVGYEKLYFHLSDEPLVVFLGLEKEKRDLPTTYNEPALFAVDVSGVDENKLKELDTEASFLEPYPGSMQLEPSEAGIFAEARSVLAWHDRYSFCSTCGSGSEVADAGYKRVCRNKECRSHKGVHNTCYPRTDPSVIMLVVSPDGKKCLLGRAKRFPPKMWSCLAGFMESGESVEDTCRREVEEESGIIVEKVEYHSSQPWPMPASLMLGCIAYATTTTIKVDDDEMEDARWFTRPEVVQMLTRQHPQGLFVPPEQAIAHQIIKTWVRRTANL